MSIVLDSPAVPDDDTDDAEPACYGCGETENLRPGPSGLACWQCLTDWAGMPDSPYIDLHWED